MAAKAAFSLSLLLGLSAQAGAEAPPADIFIGTIALEQDEVILNRCDIANNRYVLRDDALTKGDAVARYKALGTPASGPVYAEVYGRYFETQGQSGLDVLEIDAITPGRDCHLVSAIDTMLTQAGETGNAPALWLGPTAFRAGDIASLTMDFDYNGLPVLDIALSPKAGERLAVMTGQQVGRELDLRLDDRLIEQPILVEPIVEGRLRLSGRYAVQEIKQLMRDMACALGLSKATVPGLTAKERRCPPTQAERPGD